MWSVSELVKLHNFLQVQRGWAVLRESVFIKMWKEIVFDKREERRKITIHFITRDIWINYYTMGKEQYSLLILYSLMIGIYKVK